MNGLQQKILSECLNKYELPGWAYPPAWLEDFAAEITKYQTIRTIVGNVPTDYNLKRGDVINIIGQYSGRNYARIEAL